MFDEKLSNNNGNDQIQSKVLHHIFYFHNYYSKKTKVKKISLINSINKIIKRILKILLFFLFSNCMNISIQSYIKIITQESFPIMSPVLLQIL